MTIKPFLLLGLLWCSCASAQETADRYKINAGDVLSLHVWNEPELSAQQVVVRPDGYISLPIVGEISVAGLPTFAVEQRIKEALKRFVRDNPTVVINAVSMAGNAVYVLGKVTRPGAYVMAHKINVMQALSLAGGLTTFADENSIKILRTDDTGTQVALLFRYDQIKKGKRLENNYLLQSGDVVVVP